MFNEFVRKIKFSKKIKKEKLIFCPSYMQVPATITLASKNNFFFIVTECNSLYNLFINFYPKSKIILLESAISILNINPFLLFKNLVFNYLLKKKIKYLFNKYINCDVFFTGGANLPQLAYAIKILSLKNNMNYIEQDIYKNLFKRISNPPLKFFFYIIYLRLMYGLNCHAVSNNNKLIFLFYSNQFYKFINAKKISLDINIKLLKSFQKKNFPLKNKKILFLSSSEAIQLGTIDKDAFKSQIHKCCNFIKLKEILFKRKSINEKKYFIENIFFEAPPEWPANILVYGLKVVVGYHSATLYEAANAGCKSISLLNLFQTTKTFKNSNFFKKYLIMNLDKNKRIFFPRSWIEFENIIRTY
jgi:hypothetical protein